jgi:hypothetical protein
VGQDGQSLFAHLPDVGGGTRIALDRAALIGQASLIGRQCFEPVGLRTELAKIDFAAPAIAGRSPRCARGR